MCTKLGLLIAYLIEYSIVHIIVIPCVDGDRIFSPWEENQVYFLLFLFTSSVNCISLMQSFNYL